MTSDELAAILQRARNDEICDCTMCVYNSSDVQALATEVTRLQAENAELRIADETVHTDWICEREAWQGENADLRVQLAAVTAERDEARAKYDRVYRCRACHGGRGECTCWADERDQLRSRVADLEQVASRNPERMELLTAKYSNQPYDKARLDALQESVRTAFNRDEDMLRMQLTEARAALENTRNVLRAGAFTREQIAEECDLVLARMSGNPDTDGGGA